MDLALSSSRKHLSLRMPRAASLSAISIILRKVFMICYKRNVISVNELSVAYFVPGMSAVCSMSSEEARADEPWGRWDLTELSLTPCIRILLRLEFGIGDVVVEVWTIWLPVIFTRERRDQETRRKFPSYGQSHSWWTKSDQECGRNNFDPV